MPAPTVQKAAALEIGKLNQPVVTLYQVALIIFELYQAGSYRGEKLASLKKSHANRSDCTRNINALIENGVLEESNAVRHKEVFSVLGRESSSINEIACSVDPFAYISHLSAMEWHGLTDRIGRVLTYSSPPPKRWREHAWQKMQKDLGQQNIQEFFRQNLPQLKRLNVKKISRVSVHRYLSDHLGAFVSIKGRCLRVSTIGRTFLDMIREPNLCGGIRHVIDAYTEHAPRYQKQIIDEIDRHGTKIDKVRAGYVLEEHANITSPAINTWTEFAQRGGSRKLDANSPYSPDYSERWCLSLNLEA
ncbi:type IV toxin-antitoxin system AbiEi family antitoxin domain-containing protein [Pelagibius sp.]|uniref:type IV toxin-antitoxin system AbiEi family antitoxin domain-containing protein n=1 Tax=Pelagibius sp. TaxID=1931238 RepID=UPI003BAEB001